MISARLPFPTPLTHSQKSSMIPSPHIFAPVSLQCIGGFGCPSRPVHQLSQLGASVPSFESTRPTAQVPIKSRLSSKYMTDAPQVEQKYRATPSEELFRVHPGRSVSVVILLPAGRSGSPELAEVWRSTNGIWTQGWAGKHDPVDPLQSAHAHLHCVSSHSTRSLTSSP